MQMASIQTKGEMMSEWVESIFNASKRLRRTRKRCPPHSITCLVSR